MTIITPETINDKLCTVIWHDESLVKDKNALKLYAWSKTRHGFSVSNSKEIFIEALFAFPRNPTAKDAALYSQYKACGIHIMLDLEGSGDLLEPYDYNGNLWLDEGHYGHRPICDEDIYSHAEFNGECVEIAIQEAV